jgi:eukaryotic-like serine/threonine-protein kinase
LTGDLPFSGTTRMLLHQVQYDEPRPPRRLNDRIPRDLETICLKAMAKEPGSRYATAGEFAQDLHRFLQADPIHARPAGSAERTFKWARRRPAIAGLLVAVVFVTLAGVSGILVMYGRAVAALQEAEKSRDAEAEQRREAVRAAEAEREANVAARANALETQSVLEFVTNKIFAAARPKGKEGGLGTEITLRQAIDAALPSIEKSFANQPLVEGRLRMTLGQSLIYLGEPESATKQFEAGYAIYSTKRGADHADTLKAMNNLAIAYTYLHRFDDALKLQEKALALCRSTLGPEHIDTLKSMSNLSMTFTILGKQKEAIKLQTELLELFEAKYGPDHASTLAVMINLANSYHSLGQNDEAIKLQEKTLKLQKVKLGDDNQDTLQTMNNLANSYGSVGRHKDAAELLEKAMAAQITTLGPDHPDTLASMNNLAERYMSLGRSTDALKLNKEALKVRRAKDGENDPDTLRTMLQLAINYAALGRDTDALQLTSEAAARWEKLNPTDNLALYDAACGWAFAAGVIRARDKGPKGIADANVEAAKAMIWLKNAISAGYQDVANLQVDADLDSLRDRDDFKEMIKDLKAKAGAEKK